MPAKKATHQLTKQHNRDLILKTLFDHPQISRAEIARTTKLTRATVSDMVADLIEEGLVWIATMLEILDAVQVKRFGPQWWVETDIEQFAPKKKSNDDRS